MLAQDQPEQDRAVTWPGREEIDPVAVCRLARAHDIPDIVSTVGVAWA